MRGLIGKTAMVTGGGSGIGKAIVEHLLEEGVNVISMDLNNDGLKEISEKYDGKLVGVKGSVANEKDVENAVATAVEKFGQLNFGFNVAGIVKTELIINHD